MENNPTLMSLFSFFFSFDERNMYRPRCEKKKGKITNKTNWSAEERNENKT
jgi:hypothetical protein